MPPRSKAEADREAALERERTAERCRSLMSTGQLSVADTIRELAAQWRGQAVLISEQRRTAWKTRSTAYGDAARLADETARELEKFNAELPECTSGDGCPRHPDVHELHAPSLAPGKQPAELSHATNGDGFVWRPPADTTPGQASVEAQLDAAFGTTTPPVVHIRTMLEGDTYGRLCGASTGPFGYPGKANCEDCIAQHDQPVTPPVAAEIRQENEAMTLNDALATVSPAAERVANAISELTSVHITGMDPSAPERIAALPDVSGTLSGIIAPALPAFSAPTGPARRLTFAEVAGRRVLPDHYSVSAISDAADCGVKFALRGGPEVPAWWNVAGRALHAQIEAIETGQYPSWEVAFMTEIEATRIAATGIPLDRWRAAKGGSENYDWWRVQGALFQDMYVTWHALRARDGWRILQTEVPFRMPIPGAKPIDGFIDSIWIRQIPDAVPAFEIIDFKFGSSLPAELFQVGVYAHAWATAGGFSPDFPIGAAYYHGRKGELAHHVADVRKVVTFEDIVYRTRVTQALDEQRLYMPRRSSFCGACGVRELCPVGAT